MTTATVWVLVIFYSATDRPMYGPLPTHEECIRLAGEIAPGKPFTCKPHAPAGNYLLAQ